MRQVVLASDQTVKKNTKLNLTNVFVGEKQQKLSSMQGVQTKFDQ
jgi:hypothetical protein